MPVDRGRSARFGIGYTSSYVEGMNLASRVYSASVQVDSNSGPYVEPSNRRRSSRCSSWIACSAAPRRR
ncbi:MAG TPA: hypothetical protein VJ302_35710 [Blastocatellia bacterium]|nr:hypothetical protein [Blastocatellia bacterium]